METEHATDQRARGVSIATYLALFSGGAMLFAFWKFTRYTQRWPPIAQILFLFLGLALLLYGVRRTIVARRSGTPQQSLNRNRVLLPREGMVYLAIMVVVFVGSLIGHSNMLRLVFALMAGPFVLNGWITFTLLKRTGVTRSVAPRGMAGETISVEIVLENRKRWISSWLMAARDRISDGRQYLEAGVLFARVPPKQKRTACYRMRLMERGRYHLGPIELGTRFPLGLVERGLIVDVEDEILIHPRIGHLSNLWRRDTRQLADVVQRSISQRGVFDDEFQRLREYREGDNPKAIHWRTSARKGELMVREYHQKREQHLFVLLDLWIPPGANETQRQRVETAVSLVATVCLEHLRESRDRELTVYTCGANERKWTHEAGHFALTSLLDLLALVEAGRAERVGRMLEIATRQASPQTKLLLVTTRTTKEGGFGGLGERTHDRNVPTVEIDASRFADYFITSLDEGDAGG